MSVTTTVKKTASSVAPLLDLDQVRKPLFAAVGVADLAIEQVKDLPADAQTRLGTTTIVVKSFPAQVKSLRGEVEARVAQAGSTATGLYAQLAVRGERLVGQIRRQPSTEAAVAEGKEAVRKAQAASTAAKKSVRAGERAVEDAAAKIG